MYNTIETRRLVLKILDKKSADLVLEFLKENREDFSKYEAEKQEMYFTKFYQEYIIQCEYDATMKKGYLRYYLFEKSDLHHIIGTVSVGQIRAYPYCSGIIGYKMAVNKKKYGIWHRGGRNRMPCGIFLSGASQDRGICYGQQFCFYSSS